MDLPTDLRELVAPEDDALAAARERAEAAPSPAIGAFLRWLAASVGARHVVEVGSAGGVTGLWLLRGMAARGVLTSVEPDPQTQSLAARAYADAGVEGRVRSILGEADAVLGRLSDGGYDLCLLQPGAIAPSPGLEHALRLLRGGGLLVARGVVETPDLVAALVDREAVTTTVLPLDGGLAVATVGQK